MTSLHKSGFGYLIAGFLLFGVSDVVEIRGDIAPMAASGVSGERLIYHVLALLILVGSVVCFVRGGYLMLRQIAVGPAKPDAELVRVFADEPGTDFDADAVLARYMARKQDRAPDEPPEPPQPQLPRGGFGRKGV